MKRSTNLQSEWRRSTFSFQNTDSSSTLAAGNGTHEKSAPPGCLQCCETISASCEIRPGSTGSACWPWCGLFPVPSRNCWAKTGTKRSSPFLQDWFEYIMWGCESILPNQNAKGLEMSNPITKVVTRCKLQLNWRNERLGDRINLWDVYNFKSIDIKYVKLNIHCKCRIIIKISK